MSRTTGRAFA
jgi:DNA-directed RNA polymerase II subunit RPB1